MDKKHLNLPSKFFLFICFSTMNVLPFIFACKAESTAASICISQGLSYEHGLGGTIALLSFFTVLIIGIILLIIAESVVYRKTDIPDGLLILSPFATAFAFVLTANLMYYFNDIFHDGELFLLYCSILGIIKAIYDIIRLIKIKNYKLIPLCLICLAGVILCWLSPYLYEYYQSYIESVRREPFI